MLKKERARDFRRTKYSQISFDKLKQALQTSTVLAYPDMKNPFRLTCDASNSALGLVLGQLDKEHVIAYRGKSLSRSQLNWTTTENSVMQWLKE